ncbi:MAG: BON domain-containing protein [Candidatus Kapaibacterium sp.]
MRITETIAIAICALGLLTTQACKSKVEVQTTADSSTVSGSRMDTAGKNNTVGQELTAEMIEKKVEAKLIAEPGFGGITVSSGSPGAIILTGTVATENELGRAKVLTEGTDGVKSVDLKGVKVVKK